MNHASLPPKAPELSKDITVKHFIFNKKSGVYEVQNLTEKFIKGPIPLLWITRANSLPGKVGAIGIALWFLAGVKKSRNFKLTGEVTRIACCERKTLYPALKALEESGLISVQRSKGARSMVTLLDCDQ